LKSLANEWFLFWCGSLEIKPFAIGVGMPGNPQYLFNEPTEKLQMQWYKPEYPCRFNKNLTYLSVPVRSLNLTSKYIDLNEKEVQAIVYHDGQYVNDNRSVATQKEPLTLLVQYADSWIGFVLEMGDWIIKNI